MSEEEKRRPLYKRQPTIIKTYQPPYTSLRQPESEKLRVRSPEVKAPVLGEIKTGQTWSVSQKELGTQFSGAELLDLQKRMFSAENQAALELKAKEAAERAKFEEDAKKELKEWERSEVNSLDSQIEAELEKQGITKQTLQDNAKLRNQITKWKRENTAKFKQQLIETEWNVIQESKAKFASAQRENRETLKSNLATYENEVRNAVESVQRDRNDLMKEAGWTGNWVDFTKHAEEQRAITSQLVAKKTIKISGSNIEVIKPASALTDGEIDLLNKVGFNIPKGGKRIEVGLYEFGEKYLSGPAQEATEYFSAVLGDFFDAIEAPVKLFAMLPGEQPFEEQLKTQRTVTAQTLKYYEDLTPGQKAAVYTGGAAATLGGALVTSYIMALPIGATSHGIKLLAQSPKIQAAFSHLPSFASVDKLHLSSKIATYLAKHPKITQAIVWSPIAGLEAGNVVRKLNEGVPIEDILGQEAINISQMYGSLKGFQAGYKAGYRIFDPFDKTPISRWVRMEEIYKRDGTVELKPIVDKKYIPKEIADLIRTEIDPLTGKEVLVGFEQTTKGYMPMTREYGKFMEQLIRAKTVSTKEVLGVMKQTLGESGLKTLYSRGYDVAVMTPKEIAIAAYKELGYGTPWFEMLQKTREPIKWTGKKSLELLGMAAEETTGKTPLELLRIKDLYNDLRALGYDATEAQYWTSQILSKSPEQIAGKMLSVIEHGYEKEKLIELSLQYNAGSKSAVSALLSSKGLNPSQIEEVIKIAVSSIESPEMFAASAAKISDVAMASAVKLISPRILIEAVPFLNVKPLSVVIRNVADEVVGAIAAAVPAHTLSLALSEMSPSDLSRTIPLISTDTMSIVLPELKHIPLSNTFMALTPEQLNKVLPNLSQRDWSTIIPNLSPKALNRVVPSLTPEQFNQVMPNLTPAQIEEVIPKLTPEQLNYTLTALDIPPNLLLRYLQTGQLGRIEGIPPILLKKLLDEKAKRNKKEMEKQKTRLFEVILYYYSESERFRIKNKSFHGAAREALNRRKGVPIRVTVRVVKEGIK